jgi:tartrate-resistant acid phosphatase type 5
MPDRNPLPAKSVELFRYGPILGIALVAVLLANCSPRPREAPPAVQREASLRFLVVGDTGYHYDYLSKKELAKNLTPELFLEEERTDWIEDKRPIADFEPPPMHTLANGSVVTASGLHAVASAMRSSCAQPPRCEFAVMLGDNIYPDGATLGADGHDDQERFRKLFAEPFGSLFGGRGQPRIYTVLGNHDWHTSRAAAQAQVDYLASAPPFYMDGFFYRVIPPGSRGDVEIFALDTHMLLAASKIPEGTLADDGSEVVHDVIDPVEPWAAPETDAERAMADWLDASLRGSTARWKVVIGHHPLWSSAGTKFEQARVLRKLLLPALCRHADMYLAGHDHTLEVLTDDCTGVGQSRPEPLPLVISGAGSKQRGVNSAFAAHQLRNNPQLRTLWTRGMVWGFADVTLDGDHARVRVFETPESGSGETRKTFEHEFSRRTRAAN